MRLGEIRDTANPCFGMERGSGWVVEEIGAALCHGPNGAGDKDKFQHHPRQHRQWDPVHPHQVCR